MNDQPVRLHAHRPERRRPSTVTLPCGCCCCCCCCLHTLGGLLGAAVASTVAAQQEPVRRSYFYDYYSDEYPDISVAAPRRGGMSAAAIYWAVFGALTLLAVFIACAGGGRIFGVGDLGGNVAGALMILAIFLPAVQFVASLIAIPIAAATDRANAAARVWTVGKITLGFLVGTGIGFAVMFLTCVGFGGLR